MYFPSPSWDPGPASRSNREVAIGHSRRVRHRMGPPERALSRTPAVPEDQNGPAGGSRMGKQKKKWTFPRGRCRTGRRMGPAVQDRQTARDMKTVAKAMRKCAVAPPTSQPRSGVCCTLSHGGQGSPWPTKPIEKSPESKVPGYILCSKTGHLTACKLRASASPKGPWQDAARGRADLASLLGNRHARPAQVKCSVTNLLIQPRIFLWHVSLASHALGHPLFLISGIWNQLRKTFHRLRHSTPPARCRPSSRLTGSFRVTQPTACRSLTKPTSLM